MADAGDRSRRDFAAWKFAAIDAMAAGLPAREFRVAVRLLSHMSQEDRLIYPSQKTMAIVLKMDESAIRRSIKSLVDIGLIDVQRHNRQRSNNYAFVNSKLNEFHDLLRDREEEARRLSRQRADRAKVSAHNLPDGEEAPYPDQEELPSPDRAKMSSKSFPSTIGWNTESKGIEEGGSITTTTSTAAREEADGGSEPPEGERAPEEASGRHQTIAKVTDALLQTDIVRRRRTPAESLDELDAAERKRRRDWATSDPRYRGVL